MHLESLNAPSMAGRWAGRTSLLVAAALAVSGCQGLSAKAPTPPVAGAVLSDSLIAPGEEANFEHLWQVTFGGQNAEAYWRFAGDRLSLQLTDPTNGAGGAGAGGAETGGVTATDDRSPWVLVANLPYNVATPLICDLLDEVPAIHRMLVMVQREAAERFAARPRTSAYGAVSVKTAYWGDARIVGHVPASVFVPPPNVESALVEITRHEPPPTDPGALFGLVRTAFGQRRKMLRRSLAGIVAPDTFEAAGISPTARPEELDVDAWCRLTDAHLAAGRPTPSPTTGDPTGSGPTGDGVSH